MSFSLRLANDMADVEPGVSTAIRIELKYSGLAKERFEIEVEGIDPHWVAVPMPVFPAETGEARTEKIYVKPPRESESVAGDYPFVVRVRALSDGESQSVQGVIRVQPYSHLSMDIQPKRGIFSPVIRQNTFRVTVINLGNTLQSLKLYASEPEDRCAFGISEEEVTVGPGSQKGVEVVVTPTSRKLVASSRLYGFTVGCRSIGNGGAATGSTQGQLEHRPLLAPGGLLVGILLLILGGGWFALIPKPPQLEMLVLDKNEVLRGAPLTVRWRALNSKMIRVSLNGRHVFSSPEPVGSYTIDNSQEAGTLAAIAVRDSKQSDPLTASFTILEPPVAPTPKIVQFEVSTKSLRTGETFLVKYKTESAEKLILQPLGRELVPTELGEYQVSVAQPGVVSYTLVATNGNKTTRSEPIRVAVTDATEVAIVVFRAEPLVVDITTGKVNLIYQLSNAVRAELVFDGQAMKLEVPDGEVEFSIAKATEYTLIGYDEQGRTAVKKVRVSIKEPVRPIDPPSSDGGSPNGMNVGEDGDSLSQDGDRPR